MVRKQNKYFYIGSQRIVSKLGDLDSYGQDPRRIAYAGADVDGANVDYPAKYAISQQIIKDNYADFEVPYNGTDNDDYVNGGGFCCDDNPRLRAGAIGNGNDNPETYQYYYHSDHLGSTSLITNLDGDVVQHVEYVPFGEVFIEERNNTWNTPYLFNAKELDEETGLYYYGARYYNPRISLWLSVDQMWEKYPGISVYAYCINNPIRYIDPDGREVWIVIYGENGQAAERMLYTPGMQYKGQNEFFQKTISVLNKMNSVESGSTVLNSLSSSANKYYYTNVAPTNGSDASTVPNGDDAYFLMGNNASLENTAHELFHGYQLEKGVGGQSITNEVEAYAFGYSVAYTYALDHYTDAESQAFLNQSTNVGQNHFLGRIYNNSFQSLLTDRYTSLFDYFTAISFFKSGALVNSSGFYNNYPIQRSNPNKGLLRSFQPLIK